MLFAIRALPAMAALVVMLYFSRHLSRDLYGVYQNFWVRYALLSTVACLGLPGFLLALPREAVLGWLQQLGARHLLFFAGLSGILGAAFALWERPSLPLWLPPVFLLLYSGATLLEGILLAARSYLLPLVCNAVYTGAFIGLHVFWMRMPGGLPQLLVLLLALGSVRALVFAFGCRRLLADAPAGVRLDAAALRLWRHLGVYDLLQQGARVADKVMVSFLVPPALAAVYFNGAQEVPFLPLLLGAASGALLQQVSAGGGQDAASEARWAQYTGRLLASIVFPLFWWLLLFRDELFAVVFSTRYLSSAAIFAAALLVLPLRAYPFTALLQRHGRGGTINAGALLDLVAAFLLAPVFYASLGLPGIALAFSVVTVLLAVFYVAATVKGTGIPVGGLLPVRDWIGKLLLFGGITLSLYCGTQGRMRPGLQLALGGVVAAATAVAAIRYDLKNTGTLHGNTGKLPKHP